MADEKKTAPKKRGRGRPEKILTPEELELMDQMAKDGCRHRTISVVLGVSRDNLRKNHMKRLHQKAAEGRVELRADQRRMSKTQPALAIFLGKNRLGQTDKRELGVSGEISLKPPTIT